MKFLKSIVIFTFFISFYLTQQVQAFCGFYVSRDDGALYNTASKVVYTRNNSRSVITMSSDYRGPASEFAMIVPTPGVLSKRQVKTVKAKTIEHLDAYSAPRLVEYFDDDPCNPSAILYETAAPNISGSLQKAKRYRGAKALGVTIRAEYAVGNYDIVMLSAKQSDGLITFLRQDGYTVPNGAESILQDYIKAGMKFFVAKVNLRRHTAGKSQDLSPLQITFRSKNFMLPIQLGKINSTGAQDVLLLTLTKSGRVDIENYKVRKIPTDVNIPVFIEDFFPQFFTAMFNKVAPKSGAVLEYAWDMAWCDPCAADPLSKSELKELGVNWLKRSKNAGEDVFVTRLHLRYSKNTFAKDLMLKITGDSSNFQGRYVLNHPFEGDITCEAGQQYVRATKKRLKDEAIQLRRLTGWRAKEIDGNIRKSMPAIYR